MTMNREGVPVCKDARKARLCKARHWGRWAEHMQASDAMTPLPSLLALSLGLSSLAPPPPSLSQMPKKGVQCTVVQVRHPINT